MQQTIKKRETLVNLLKACPSLAVAFSGGADSAFLAAVAREVLGDRMMAIKAVSPIHPRREHQAALAFAARHAIPLKVIVTAELALPGFSQNPPDRCYRCKKYLMSAMLAQAARMGLAQVAHGANRDDLDDYRPGFKAARELGIAAPLLEAGLTKAEIRSLSREMGLSTWNRPSMACLASRIPYGTLLSEPVLEKVEQAEEILEGLGFGTCRVRHYGNLARIEVSPGRIPDAAVKSIREVLVHRLQQLGYDHVCLDLEGYTPGSLNRGLEENDP